MNLICTGGGSFLQRGSPSPTSLASSACAAFLIQSREELLQSGVPGMLSAWSGLAVGSCFVAWSRFIGRTMDQVKPSASQSFSFIANEHAAARIQTVRDSRRDGTNLGSRAGIWMYSFTTNHLSTVPSMAAGVVAWILFLLQGGGGYRIRNRGSSPKCSVANSCWLQAALRVFTDGHLLTGGKL